MSVSRLVLPLGSGARTSQRGLHGADGSLDAMLLVGEQAGVLGRP